MYLALTQVAILKIGFFFHVDLLSGPEVLTPRLGQTERHSNTQSIGRAENPQIFEMVTPGPSHQDMIDSASRLDLGRIVQEQYPRTSRAHYLLITPRHP